MRPLSKVDPEVAQAIREEETREEETLELIASENFASRAVMEATGSVMTNKYAEGYPAKRWYQGCRNMDRAEALAIERAKELFKAEHANVQPHSGSQANMAVYFAMLQPGDTILAMNLAHGGHLTHGNPVNFSGRFFKIVSYGVRRDTECIDYDEMEKLALEHKPKLILAGGSAYPRAIDFERLRAIADKVGAYAIADMAHFAGLVVAGIHPDPVPHCQFVTTTTHKTLRGPRGGIILCKEEFAKEIDSQVFPGIQGGPLMHIIAAKAVCFKEAMSDGFREYQMQTVANAKRLAERLQEKGIRVVSGGTDTHLLLVDLTPLGLTGKDAAKRLEDTNIVANKNLIPFDTKSPFVASGLRLGTPAVTTRGMREDDITVLADLIVDVLRHMDDDAVIERTRAAVKELCRHFPLYRAS
ncbi:MAG: serine hydroxymethyltransferase [bacterium]|nr:serine hydroxymethyltransferase [bacterium]